jgi:hypothetical protein
MQTLKKTVGMIIFLVFILIVYILLFSRDAATVNDADLLLDPVEVLDQSNNAYYVFPIIDELPGATDRAITDAFIAASKLPGYQCPTLINNYFATVELCLVHNFRNAANLVADRAKASLLIGDTADALESTLSIVRAADLLAVSNGTVIEELIAVALYSSAADALEQLVGELSSTQNKQVAEVLQQHRPDRTTLMNAIRVEYMISKDMILQVGTGSSNQYTEKDLSSYRWQPNRTTNELADWYRLILGIEPASNTEIQEELENITNISPRVLIEPNSTGKIFLSTIVGPMVNVTERHSQLEKRYDQLIASFTSK